MGAVEAGGIFSLLVTDMDGPHMKEILRFDHEWEADASVQLRRGDITGFAACDRRRRIRPGNHEATFDAAAAGWVSDHLRGKATVLVAGSNAEAADLARWVQARLAQMGRVGVPEVDLSDGNMAGAGDRIRAG